MRDAEFGGARGDCRSSLMPCPSSTLKTLKASPAGPYQSLPSVSTPSTSNSISLTRLARCNALRRARSRTPRFALFCAPGAAAGIAL
jgi:hypothetical protein